MGSRRSLPKEGSGLRVEEVQKKGPTMAEQLTRAGLGLVVSAVGISQIMNEYGAFLTDVLILFLFVTLFRSAHAES